LAGTHLFGNNGDSSIFFIMRLLCYEKLWPEYRLISGATISVFFLLFGAMSASFLSLVEISFDFLGVDASMLMLL
jgi:hypothetical protein